MNCLGLIAGKGIYPAMVLNGARAAQRTTSSPEHIVVAALENETTPEWTTQADAVCWLRVGQLNKLLHFFSKESVNTVIMAGQITPQRLFDLRPDWKTLLLLARLRERNAESLFGAVADELEKNGMRVLPATTYVENHLAQAGHIAGPQASRALLRNVEFGWPIAKQVSALDIGQTVVVKNGTVLSVEGFEGTNETILRGGRLGKKDATVIKISKPNQDFRFDVPVLGSETVRAAAEVSIGGIVCEAKKTLLLELPEITELAARHQITIFAKESSGDF
ncbi:MAG: UDP-2,3-diacylglucosamine diphosphatase LpxI [bacterium]